MMLSANWNLNRYCNIFIEILKLCSSYKYTYPSLLQAMDSKILKLDRIDEVEISMMTRKGNLINFVDHHDVKCQLEYL